MRLCYQWSITYKNNEANIMSDFKLEIRAKRRNLAKVSPSVWTHIRDTTAAVRRVSTKMAKTDAKVQFCSIYSMMVFDRKSSNGRCCWCISPLVVTTFTRTSQSISCSCQRVIVKGIFMYIYEQIQKKDMETECEKLW